MGIKKYKTICLGIRLCYAAKKGMYFMKESLRRNYKQKLSGKTVIAIAAIVCITAAIFSITKADAAYAGSYNDIGTYSDTVGGKSVNGVKISKNSKILNYALDMWEKDSSGQWKYTGSNIDNNVSEVETSGNYPVFIKGKSEPRFGININSIKSELPVNGSIVVKKYRIGKLIYEKTEFTYQTDTENKMEDSISLLKQAAKGTSKLELPSTNYSCEGVSYVYDIYDAAVIGQNGDIYTALDDCRIVSDGYAYYDTTGEYIVKKLPEVEHNEMDGYICNFDGWYTHNGNKIYVGDAIDIRTTIYPRWDISRISYNVNYIDILGDGPDGKVLGTNTLTVYCNDEASGLDIGSDESAGAYYSGMYYTGCTSATVQGDCDVYRYFRPAIYNIIFNDSMATSGETAPISNCVYGETYKLTKNGFKRNGTITLDLNAQDAVCTTKNINVAYEFKGWAETSGADTVYADCESVSDLCSADGEKQLYAVWSGKTVEIDTTPEREGYRFDGWSKDQSATSGNTWFDVSDSNDCTLYAVWIKKQEAADNSGNDTDNENSESNKNDTDNSNSENVDNKNDTNNENNGTEDNGNEETDKNTGSENLGNGSTDNDNSGDTVISGGTIDNTDDNSSTDSEPSNSPDNENNSNTNPDNNNENNSSTNNTSSGTNGGSISTGSSSTISSGSGAGNQNTGSQNLGSQNSGTGSASSSNSTNDSSSNNSTDTDDNNTTSSDDIITQNPNINTDNKKENKDDKSSQNPTIYPKAGTKYVKSGIIYKIIKSSDKKRTVTVVKAEKTITVAKVPKSIKIKGYKYKVVSISKKAFIKCSSLKKVVIGKNIKSIGKKAFYKDKELGKIIIKSKKLKSIGKSAFKRIKPKCAVKIAGSKKYSQKVFAMMNA